MPTGLTYKIYDGTDTLLRSFALLCATHITAGAVFTDRGSREMPKDKAPVVEPDSYHKEQLEASKKELEHWLNLKNKPEEAKREYDASCSCLD